MNKKILALLLAVVLVVGLVPVAAMAADECDEEHGKNTYAYPAGAGTHVWKCSNCAENMDDAAVSCVDGDGNGICDYCWTNLPVVEEPKCEPHGDNTYAYPAGAGTHVWKCSACAENMDDAAVSCVDEDGNGICDYCWTNLPVVEEPKCDKHGESTYAYPAEAGTHVWKCSACTENMDDTAAPCVDEDGNGICDYCWTNLPVVEEPKCDKHGDNTYAYPAGAGTHVWKCSYCTENMDDTAAPCVDEDGNGICDYCWTNLPVEPECDHWALTAEWTYTDNNDGTHKSICKCGVVVNPAAAHGYNEAGLCVCGAKEVKCGHVGAQDVIDNKDGATHKVVCPLCGEIITEKAAHVYAEDTGLCACGAAAPQADLPQGETDNVPKTGDMIALVLAGMMGVGTVGTGLTLISLKKKN